MMHPMNPEFLTQEALAEVARAAEAAGFDALAVTEHPMPNDEWLAGGGHDALDPFVALSFAAAATTRIQLLTNLTVVPYRNPFMLAKAAATLDRLSNGRLILGCGTGYLKEEFDALGVDFDERNALFDESLDLLRKTWSGKTVRVRGRHFEAVANTANPVPAQSRIPIWIGGNSAPALRRAKAMGDGWHGTRVPIEDIAAITADLRAARGPDFPLSMRVFWDPLEDDHDSLKAMAEAYSAAGIDALIMEPRQRGLEDWLRAVEGLWAVLQPWHD